MGNPPGSAPMPGGAPAGPPGGPGGPPGGPIARLAAQAQGNQAQNAMARRLLHHLLFLLQQLPPRGAPRAFHSPICMVLGRKMPQRSRVNWKKRAEASPGATPRGMAGPMPSYTNSSLHGLASTF